MDVAAAAMIWPGRDHDGTRRLRRRGLLAGFPPHPLLLLTTPMFHKSWLADAGGCVDGWNVSENVGDLKSANAVVFHLPQVRGIERMPKPPGQLWIGVSAECDIYYPLQVDPSLLARLDVIATYHQDSDFPLNYTCPAMLHELLQPVPPKRDDALVCALISNGDSRSGREAHIIALEQVLPIHHYGRWRSTHRSEDRGRPTKLELLRRYRFNLAYENCIDRDYVTEKWFDCLLAGCVPVYLGAPNIAEFAPSPESYIDATAFNDPAALAQHLRDIASSEERYASYFAWKRSPLPATFTKLFEGQEIPFLRRLCSWLENERVTRSL